MNPDRLPREVIAHHHTYRGDMVLPPGGGYLKQRIVPMDGLTAIHVRYVDEADDRLANGGFTLVGDGSCWGFAICSLDDRYIPSTGVLIARSSAAHPAAFDVCLPRYLSGHKSGKFRLGGLLWLPLCDRKQARFLHIYVARALLDANAKGRWSYSVTTAPDLILAALRRTAQHPCWEPADGIGIGS